MAKVTPKTAAPKTAAPASAKPGSKVDATTKKKKERVEYPGLTGEDKLPVKLKEVPSDFDPKLHKPLKRSDFENEAVYLDMKADELEAKAKKLRAEAEAVRSGGGSKKVAQKVSRLQKMAERMQKLRAEMEAEGMDVDSMLDTLSAE